MTIQSLRTIAPPTLAIAEGATSPDPGIVGVSCWSSTLAKPVYWDGTVWSAGDLHYVHNQAVASGTWTITHNLGKRPAISLLSVGGLAVWGEVLHVDTNQALVYFDNPFAGSAISS